MQEKVITGRIYRGSTAQITVQAFKCNVDPSEITEWEIFFFTDNGHSLEKTDGAVLKGNMVTVVFSKEDLDIMADGVIRYQCNYSWGDDESDMICTNTNWVLKTPEYYHPSEYPSIEEVEEVVDEKIDDALVNYYTQEETKVEIDEKINAQQFKTINGETIKGEGDIEIQTKLNDAGSEINPVYIKDGVAVPCGTSTVGKYWGTVPKVRESDGGMEVGTYIDFHESPTEENDYDSRLISRNGVLYVGKREGKVEKRILLEGEGGGSQPSVYFIDFLDRTSTGGDADWAKFEEMYNRAAAGDFGFILNVKYDGVAIGNLTPWETYYEDYSGDGIRFHFMYVNSDGKVEYGNHNDCSDFMVFKNEAEHTIRCEKISKTIEGGSGGGVTPEEVQEKIDNSLTDYYNKSQVDGKIPTKTSQLTNDKGYVTANDLTEAGVAFKDEIPTKTSQLENDSNFLTEHQHLKTINGETIVGYGNIVIQGGGSGSDICVCYLKEDKTRVGDFDELYKRVTDKDVAKPFICYFIDSGNTMYETYVKAHAYTSPKNRYLTIGIPVLETTCVLTSYNNVSFNTTPHISISKYTNHAVLSDNINAIKAVTQSQYEDMAIDENTIYFIKG